MSVNKVQLANGETIIDISDSTVTPETLAEGVTAHDASGQKITGKMVQGGGGVTDYTKLENKPTETIGGDTLTFNPSSAEELEGMVQAVEGLYKVSDSVPTESDFVNGCSFVLNGQVMSLTKEEMFFLEDGFIPLDVLFIVPYDNYNADGLIFPEAGVYFVLADGMYVTSLTIPGYTGFTKEVLKKEVLPEAHILYRDEMYLYRTADITTESNRVTAFELKAMVKSGTKILVFGIDDQTEFFYNCIGSAFLSAYGILRLAKVGPNNNLVCVNLYTAEYTAT